MTQTITSPKDRLLTLIVALLAPMFLCVSGGDVQMARIAALETVNGYRIRHRADLVAVAQIIALGLAALCALSRSMEDDISTPDMLQLHSDAVALNRAAEQNRRAVRQNRHDDMILDQSVPEPAPEPELTASTAEELQQIGAEAFLSAIAAQHLAAEADARLHGPEQPVAAVAAPLPPSDPPIADITEKRHDEMCAIAMVNEASEITASIPHLPPIERRTATLRAAVLGSTANQLLTGVNTLSLAPQIRMPQAKT